MGPEDFGVGRAHFWAFVAQSSILSKFWTPRGNLEAYVNLGNYRNVGISPKGIQGSSILIEAPYQRQNVGSTL